jgi:hypothetical protein
MRITYYTKVEGGEWLECAREMHISQEALDLLSLQKLHLVAIAKDLNAHALRFDPASMPHNVRSNFQPVWDSLNGFRKLQGYSVSRDPATQVINIKITECKHLKTSEVLRSAANMFQDKGD